MLAAIPLFANQQAIGVLWARRYGDDPAHRMFTPAEVRLLSAIADVWDALMSDRPYRVAWPKEKALKYIREQTGSHFDPKVVEGFLKLLAL